MGRGKLTSEEIKILQVSPWISEIKRDKIMWKDSFKEHFIQEYKEGKDPTQIFADAGFPRSLVGSKRIERAAANWREVYRVPARKRPEEDISETENK